MEKNEMAQKKYKFNPETLAYESVPPPRRLRVYRFLRKLLIGFILASLVNFAFSYFFYTPKMMHLNRETQDLLIQYGLLQDKIASASRRINVIKNRDAHVYRMLFGTDTLNIAGIYNNYPYSKYAGFADYRYGELITDTWMRLDELTRLLYLESVSLDQLQLMSVDKEQMSTAIPAIWPIDRRALRGSIGAFGGRNHPILGRFIMHTGIDLAANRGTPVYATGNGVVVKDIGMGTGYGKQILIDHGFGYKTRYAHLDQIDVVAGQQVVRGEKIGEVGNTGRSTSSHLHYEVIYMGNHVNPINYFRKDMNEAEFARIIESARETTYETLE